MAGTHSLSKLVAFIRRTEWSYAYAEVIDRHLGSACGKFGIEPAQIFDILGDVAGATLHGCALEDFMSREYEDDRNVVDEYLKKRGYAESPGNKRYIQALRNSVMSIYEVSDVVPGQSFLARDLIRDEEPVRVLEVNGSKSMKPWDRIGARLIRQGSEWRMSGGVLPFQRRASDFLIDTLRRIDGRLPDDLRADVQRRFGAEAARKVNEDLSMMAPTITGVWLADALESALNPQMPELVNSDGHPIVMCTSTFAVVPGVKMAACRKALEGLPNLVKVSSKLFNWVRAKDAVVPSRPSGGIAMMSTTETGDTLMGSLEVKKDCLVLTTNSRQRCDVAEAMISGALAGLVSAPDRDEQSAAELLEAEQPAGRRSRRPDVPPEIACKLVHQTMDQHYRKTLDEPVPALGDVSPRQAVKTAGGRMKVVDWLKDMENASARGGADDPMATYDFGWIWKELGLEDERE